SDEERAALRDEAAAIERTRVTQMFERMLRCCDELGKTLQPRLVLDCALIDVATTEPLVPLGDLIERLGELEQRIGRGGGGGPSKPALKMPATGTPAPPAPAAPPRRTEAPPPAPRAAAARPPDARSTTAPDGRANLAPREAPVAPLSAVQS